MRELSEQDALAMAGGSECPVLSKEESEEMEAAVCLKRFPGGYVLGISDKARDLRLWFIPDVAAAEQEYARYVGIMRKSGSPFGESA